MINTNKIMDRLLRNSIECYTSQKHKISLYCVEKLISPLIVENDGLILLDRGQILPLNQNGAVDSNSDASYLEYCNNEIYLNDYLSDEDPILGITLGEKVLGVWALFLKSTFPDYAFKLILSYDIGEYPGANITFHRDRGNEYNIIDDDLESYQENGMYVLCV